MPDVKLYNPHDGLSKFTYMGEDFALPPNKDTAIEVPEHMAKQGITSKILADHAVASVGVWGVVILTGDSSKDESIRLEAGDAGVIEPTVRHFVTPEDKVEFFVEFYK